MFGLLSSWRPNVFDLRIRLNKLRDVLKGRVEPWHLSDACDLEDWIDTMVQEDRQNKVVSFELRRLRRDAAKVRADVTHAYMRGNP